MKAHRAARLREYLKHLDEGDEGEARRLYMLKTRYSKGRVTQQLKGFGELAGLEIAHRLGLRDKRWFDRELGVPKDAQSLEEIGLMVDRLIAEEGGDSPPWPLRSVTPAQWARLPADRRDKIDTYAHGIVDGYGSPTTHELGGSPE